MSTSTSVAVDETHGLASLNDDVLLQILSYLSVTDIHCLRRTCKALEAVTRVNAVWKSALETHVIAKDLPTARLHSLRTTTGSEKSSPSNPDEPPIDFERLTCQSLAFHDRWLRGCPKRRRLCLSPPRDHRLDDNLKLVRMHFFSRKGRDFIAAFGTRLTPSGGRILIWELLEPEPKFVGHWHSYEFNSGFVLNSDVSSDGLFAMSAWPAAGTARILILSFLEDGPDPSTSIVPLSECVQEGQHRIHALHGNRIIVTRHIPEHALIMYDWATQQSLYSLEIGPQTPARCVQVLWIHDFILVFRETILAFYRVPSASSSTERTPDDSSTVQGTVVGYTPLPPIALHRWTWRLNSLSVTERVSYATRDCRYKPLSILIRFDSYFPWPVNLLHHFVLPIDPFFDPETTVPELVTSSWPPLAWPRPQPATDSPIPSQPWNLPPVIESIIPSAIRLFGRGDTMISKYGTAIWLDSEPDSIPTGSASFVISMNGNVPVMRRGNANSELEPQPEDPADIEVGGATAGIASDMGERIAGRRLGLYVPDTDDEAQEIANNRARSQQEKTTIYATREDEGWTAFAMDEEAGRLSIADLNGNVQIWEFI